MRPSFHPGYPPNGVTGGDFSSAARELLMLRATLPSSSAAWIVARQRVAIASSSASLLRPPRCLSLTKKNWSFCVTLAARHVRRNREPLTVPARPDIGIPARSRSALGLRVGGPRVDDGEIAHDPDLHVVSLETGDPHGHTGLLQEALPIDQRSVRIGAEEIFRQDLVESPHIRVLHRSDVIAIETEKDIEIGFGLLIAHAVCLSCISQLDRRSFLPPLRHHDPVEHFGKAATGAERRILGQR